MKPRIINWTYVGLAYVLLNNTLTVALAFQPPGNVTPYFPSIIIILAVVAIIGLLKAAPWSRIVALVVLCIQALSTISASIHFAMYAGGSLTDIFVSSLIFDVFLLFLAYKLYTSEPLKYYLNP